MPWTVIMEGRSVIKCIAVSIQSWCCAWCEISGPLTFNFLNSEMKVKKNIRKQIAIVHSEIVLIKWRVKP